MADDPVSQQPVLNFCATASHRVQKDNVPIASTMVAGPIETGTATSPIQWEREVQCRSDPIAVSCRG